MLNIKSRVRRNESFDDYADIFGMVGTVISRSPFGYVKVLWDNGMEDRYSPMLVHERIREVTGDDALPRHSWDLDVEFDPPCLNCKIIQTDENELGPCRGQVKNG
jgi:hypothetical protein